MTRRTITPKEVSEILALREVGYTVLAISQRLNLSVRTIQRHLCTHGTKKGSLKAEVIAKAREELTQLITSNTTIREEAAKLISDDISHSNHIRAIILEASAQLVATNPHEAMLVMRAAAAYSTTLKNTSDTIRHSLGVDRIVEESDELPELVIRELTSQEIKQIVMQNHVDEHDDFDELDVVEGS